MTHKEAIRRSRDHFAIHDDGRPTPYLDEAEHMAIESLEKQIPKKPKPICIDYGEEPVVVSYKCDTCKLCIAKYKYKRDPTPIFFCTGYFCAEDMEENSDTAGGCYLYEERDLYDEDPFECYERGVE